MDNFINENVYQRISWNVKYEIGIKVIDDQHKHLVELCNNLYETVMKNSGSDSWREAVRVTLRECAEYVKTHFKDEQILMQASGYADYKVHKTQHDDFTLTIIETVRKFDTMNLREVLAFDKFLYDWILSHIIHDDKQYVPAIRNYLEQKSKGV